MKRVNLIIICIVILLLSNFQVFASDIGEINFNEISRCEVGDVNYDGSVNSTDMIYFRRLLLGPDKVLKVKGADLNYDSGVDIVDYVRLKKKISGINSSFFNSEADHLKIDICNAKNESYTVSDKNRIVYVAATQKSNATGSIDNPISYQTFISRNPINGINNWLKSGDVVLFKRNDIFRGSFFAQSGVKYGAYGSGVKPQIIGSEKDYSKVDWTESGNIKSILLNKSYDVGLIVFNDGEKIGRKCTQLTDIKSEFDFYFDNTTGQLSIYLTNSPKTYNSIEIGTNKKIVYIPEGASDIEISNLSIKYTGAHGIYSIGETSNITIKNCEISYVGGSYIEGYKDGTTRYGNGIEFWKGCKNIEVSKNWIYEIYDSGITHQGSGTYTVDNLKFDNNLIEKCGLASIEYWLWYNKDAGEYNSAKNVTYSNNVMRYNGYGWGGAQRDSTLNSAHIYGGGNNYNNITNFNINGNIFDQSRGSLLNITSKVNTFPILNKNTYAQKTNSMLGTYSLNDNNTFDLFADNYINKVFKDTNAKVYWY